MPSFFLLTIRKNLMFETSFKFMPQFGIKFNHFLNSICKRDQKHKGYFFQLNWQIEISTENVFSFFPETWIEIFMHLFAKNSMNLQSEIYTDGCFLILHIYTSAEDMFDSGSKKPIYFDFAAQCIEWKGLRCFVCCTLIVSNRWRWHGLNDDMAHRVDIMSRSSEHTEEEQGWGDVLGNSQSEYCHLSSWLMPRVLPAGDGWAGCLVSPSPAFSSSVTLVTGGPQQTGQK